MNVSKGSEQVTVMEPGQEVPLGAQSVIAAGVPAKVQYIPVPVVTIPDVRRPPMPPMPVMPPPAQPTGDSSLTNAFTPTPSREGVAKVANAFGSSQMSQESPMTSVAQAPQVQEVYPANPYGRMAQALPPTNMQPPMAQGAFVMDQNGTMPNPNLSAGYSQGQEPSPQAMQQMLAALRDSLYPSQREWAAESLATVDWRSNPHIVQALVTAAKDDPAATVRAGCVRCLAKMNVNTAPVLTVIQGLKTDADPRVRQEVDIALDMLSPGHTTSTVQPAGATMPLK